MGKLLITYDGRPVLTTAQAAKRYGLTPASMRKEIARQGLEPVPESLDGRTPLYLVDELDVAMKARPGRGRARAATRRAKAEAMAGATGHTR